MNRRPLRIALIAAALMLCLYLLDKAPSQHQLLLTPHSTALCAFALICQFMRGLLIPASLATNIVSSPAFLIYRDASIPAFVLSLLSVVQFAACVALAAYFERLRKPRPNALGARLLLALPQLLFALGAVAFLIPYVIYFRDNAANSHAPFSIASFVYLSSLAALPGAIFWLIYTLRTLSRLLRSRLTENSPARPQ